MSNDISLQKFTKLGQRLEYVRVSPDASEVLKEIKYFVDLLEECELTATRNVADPIAKYTEIPQMDYSSSEMTAASRISLGASVDAISESLYHELGKRDVLFIDKVRVSKKLQEFSSSQSLTDIQKHLADETIRCLQCGTYRAAVVMGWNLVYDYIRTWIFDNHLGTFNGVLTTNYQKANGDPQFTEIVEYDDFLKGQPGERVVIDVLNIASLIGGNIADDLRQYLRHRNKYAHATARLPDQDQANAYISHLIDIITEPPFK